VREFVISLKSSYSQGRPSTTEFVVGGTVCYQKEIITAVNSQNPYSYTISL